MRGIKKLYFSRFNKINKKKEIPDLIKRSGIKILFPFYHVVSDNDLPHIKNLYSYKNVAQFDDDLDFFLKYYKPLNIDDFSSGNYNKNENYFVLSFDDGLKQMFETVAPVLKARAVPAIFFINSAFADNKGLFYRYIISLIIEELKNENKLFLTGKFLKEKDLKFSSIPDFLLDISYSNKELIYDIANICGLDIFEFLNIYQPYLTSDQMKKLITEGFALGAHSMDHPNYNTISEESQISQTLHSVKFIKDNFHQQYNYFAFPFTADGVAVKVFDVLHNQLMVQHSFGTAGIYNKPDSAFINRIPMEIENYSAEEIIKNEYAYYLLKKKFGR